MSAIDVTKRIEAALNGLDGSIFARAGASPPPPPPPPPAAAQPARRGGFGAPSPASASGASRAASLPTGVRQTGPGRVEIPYYAASRYYRPEAAETFASEQKAHRAYRESLAPIPEGYDVPTAPLTSEDFGMTNAAAIKDKHHRARVQFMDWLKTDNPEIYSALVSKLESGSVGDTKPTGTTATTESTPLWQRILSGLSTLTATVGGVRAQKEILDLNIQRANQGLPPVDAASMAPVVRTEVAITPEMAADLRQGASKALLYGGIALAGIVLFSMMGKRRRA